MAKFNLDATCDNRAVILECDCKDGLYEITALQAMVASAQPNLAPNADLVFKLQTPDRVRLAVALVALGIVIDGQGDTCMYEMLRTEFLHKRGMQ